MAGKGSKTHRKDPPYSKDGSRLAIPLNPALIVGSAHPPSNRLESDLIVPPLGILPSAIMIEQKLASQQAEILRLVGENQLLAATHVALRQEIVAAQREIVRLRQIRTGVDPEADQRFAVIQVALRQELADAKQEVNRLQEELKSMHSDSQGHLENMARMESKLKAAESVKSEFEKIRYERDELIARIEHMAREFKKTPIKEQEIAALKAELDELRQRHQQARMDFELQKKISFERLEQKQAMEKNVFTMAREIEKLRAELGHAERKSHDAMLASSGGAVVPTNSATQTGAYGSNYGVQQEAMKAGQNVNNSIAGVPRSVESASEWTKHVAPSGRTFYYNTVTGATQWDRPSSMSVDAVDSYPKQRGLPEVVNLQQQQHHHQQFFPLQQPLTPTALAPQNMQGVNLSVFGISEGFGERDLASLFMPYGRVLNARVMVESNSGYVQCYGVISMESLQAAEAATAAVNGMVLLGRQIKVEIQPPRDSVPQQQFYLQPTPMQQQQGTSQGGAPADGVWQQGSGQFHWSH